MDFLNIRTEGFYSLVCVMLNELLSTVITVLSFKREKHSTKEAARALSCAYHAEARASPLWEQVTTNRAKHGVRGNWLSARLYLSQKLFSWSEVVEV